MDHIVVAIEFDKELEDIVEFTIDLLKGKKTEVHVIHAYQSQSALVDYAPQFVDALARYEEHLQDQADSVRMIVRRLADASIRAHGYMKPIEKNITDAILEFSAGKNAGLIIVGSHHPSRLERWVLGNITEKLIRQSSIPVVAVPRKKE